MFALRKLPVLALVVSSLVGTGFSEAATLTNDHPTVALVQKYFKHVVDEDWKAAAAMLSPDSLERKKQKALDVVRRAPTMSVEAEMLAQLGLKELKQLETMSPSEFYSAERSGVAKGGEKADAIKKQKQDSLKVVVLGVIGEQNDTVVHLAVRTSQSVLDKSIEELIFISFRQNPEDKANWMIVPDMQVAVTRPLADSTVAPAAATPAPAAPQEAPVPPAAEAPAAKGAKKSSKK
jgi:hypothetical protein